MSTSTDILWYGRGGQGAFSAAKLLGASYAFSGDETFALAFPSFGPERRGAPVRAYTKLATAPVNDRSAVTVPDYALCLDGTLLQDFAGMQIKDGGFVLTTTPTIEEFAVEYLGRPIVNTVLLALLCARTGIVGAAGICRGIEETLPSRIQEKNKALVQAAFDACDTLLQGALSQPSETQRNETSNQKDVPAIQELVAEGADVGGMPVRNPDLGFEYMNLLTADGFEAPQRLYGMPSEGDER